MSQYNQPTPEELAIQAQLKAQYPYLVANEVSAKGKALSSWARGAKNIRRILRHEFPGVKFKVTSDAYANGTSIYIHWTLGKNAPTARDVNALVDENFSSKRFDGMTDSETFDDDLLRRQFRKLFGSAGYVTPQATHPTPEEIAQKEAAALQEQTPKAPKRRGGMRL